MSISIMMRFTSFYCSFRDELLLSAVSQCDKYEIVILCECEGEISNLILKFTSHIHTSSQFHIRHIVDKRFKLSIRNFAKRNE